MVNPPGRLGAGLPQLFRWGRLVEASGRDKLPLDASELELHERCPLCGLRRPYLAYLNSYGLPEQGGGGQASNGLCYYEWIFNVSFM